MRRKPTIPSDARSALVVAGVLVVTATAIGDGTLGLLAGFVTFGLLVFAMTRIPIRVSMMGLAFLAMTLPNPGEGQPTEWEPPFTIAGAALLTHLNTLDRDSILGLIPLSAMELFFVALLLIWLHRRSSKSKIDGPVVATPRPLMQLCYLSLATTAFTWIKGLAFGGEFAISLWQLNAVIYLPIIFLLLQAGFRGPADHGSLACVYLGAAVYKTVIAVYVSSTQTVPADPFTGNTAPAYATSHADSMLFAVCFVIVAAPLLEKADRKAKRLALIMIPILIAGILANNRRLAWVQIGVVGLIVYLVSRENKMKRFLRRALLLSSPGILAYIAAGWNSQAGSFFKPVRTIRSVVEPETDLSSQWREFENANIIATFRDNPIFGSGYGHPYKEIIPLPAVDYSLERYVPHNSLLGLWGYGGLIGFCGLTLFWVVGVYFAMRSYHHARDPSHRSAAIVSFGAVPIYLAQCFGDIGLPSWTGVFMMAASLTIAGKLAVVSGQWKETRAPKRAAR